MIMMDLEKIGYTWGGARKKKQAGSAIGAEKEFPDEKVLLGRYALGLRKKSKATMYRSEDIGARKQSAGRRVGKNFPSPMENLSLSEVCFLGGSIFRRTKKKFPDEKVFHGISLAGLRKNFATSDSVDRSGDMGRLEKIWPDRRSAGGGRRHAKSLGSKKKVACRVWLVRCSLYVREGASRVKIGVESM